VVDNPLSPVKLALVLIMEYKMLESLYISKSKTRRDLLALFFTNPGKKYYLRELGRLLGYSVGNIRRELLKFQSDQLLKAQRTGNLVYYSIDPDHPLFEELKSIVSKTIGLEGSIRNSLSQIRNIQFAFIYGSFASKSEKESSDIDVMIIGDPDISLLNEKTRELEQRLKREISLSIYSWEEYEIKKKGKSGFILDFLKRPKIMLIGNENDL